MNEALSKKMAKDDEDKVAKESLFFFPSLLAFHSGKRKPIISFPSTAAAIFIFF